MKTLSALLGTALVLLMLAVPVMAGQCPSLSHQIDNKVAAMTLPQDKAAQVKALQEKGMEQHRAGQHAASVQTLKQALALLAE
jgi:hypothetical protein